MITDRLLVGAIVFGLIGLGIAYALVEEFIRTHKKPEPKKRPTRVSVDNEQFNEIAKRAIQQQTMKSFIAETEWLSCDCEVVKESDDGQV